MASSISGRARSLARFVAAGSTNSLATQVWRSAESHLVAQVATSGGQIQGGDEEDFGRALEFATNINDDDDGAADG